MFCNCLVAFCLLKKGLLLICHLRLHSKWSIYCYSSLKDTCCFLLIRLNCVFCKINFAPFLSPQWLQLSIVFNILFCLFNFPDYFWISVAEQFCYVCSSHYCAFHFQSIVTFLCTILIYAALAQSCVNVTKVRTNDNLKTCHWRLCALL